MTKPKQIVSHVSDAGQTGGLIVHYKRPSTEPRARREAVNGVRASVVFPTSKIPGYYLIMGEKLEKNKVNKRSLLFLTEGEYSGYAELLWRFSSDAVRLKCSIIYCPKETGFLYGLKKRVPTIYAPNHLPFDDDEVYGKILVSEYLADGSLEIPKDTVLSEHLLKTSDDTLPPGFHTLRHIIGGFLTDDTVRTNEGARTVEVADHYWG